MAFRRARTRDVEPRRAGRIAASAAAAALLLGPLVVSAFLFGGDVVSAVAAAVTRPHLSDHTKRALSGTENMWVCEKHAVELVEMWADDYGVRTPGVIVKPDLWVRALYEAERGIIWMEGCGPISIVAHEFAHHIQYVVSGPTQQDILRVSAPFCDLYPDCAADPDRFLAPHEDFDSDYPQIIEIAAHCIGEQILGYPAPYVTCSTDAERDLAARLLSYARGYHTPAETSAG